MLEQFAECLSLTVEVTAFQCLEQKTIQIKSNQFISSHTTDIHNLQNQSNENIPIMCNGEYPRSLVLRLYGLPMY